MLRRIRVKTIQTTAIVTADGKVTLQLPHDISPGEHQVIVIIDDRAIAEPLSPQELPELNDLPVIHVGDWSSVAPHEREER